MHRGRPLPVLPLLLLPVPLLLPLLLLPVLPVPSMLLLRLPLLRSLAARQRRVLVVGFGRLRAHHRTGRGLLLLLLLSSPLRSPPLPRLLRLRRLRRSLALALSPVLQ